MEGRERGKWTLLAGVDVESPSHLSPDDLDEDLTEDDVPSILEMAGIADPSSRPRATPVGGTAGAGGSRASSGMAARECHPALTEAPPTARVVNGRRRRNRGPRRQPHR